MQAILTNAGFYLVKSCNCGNGYIEKYDHMTNKSIRVNIRPHAGTWSLYIYENIKANGIAQYLQENLNNYV